MGELTAQQLLERSIREPMDQRRATLLQAIAAADAEQDLDAGFRIRTRYISVCENAPDSLNMIASFGWCVARHDEDPIRFPLQLWYYKWVTDAARRFAGVSRDQLYELLDDMERRYNAVGASAGPALKARMLTAVSLGDLDLIPDLFETWRSATRGGRVALNDCAACDRATESEMLQHLGKHDEAVQLAGPLLERRQGCSTQPQYTFATILESCRALGGEDDLVLAELASSEGLQLIGERSDFIDAHGDHLRHLAATGRLTDGLDLLQRTAHLADGTDEKVLSYARGARMVLSLAQARNEPGLADLFSRFDGVAERLLARFDDRNGNTVASSALARDDEELARSL